MKSKLLTDIIGIWINTDSEKFNKIKNMFFIKNNIDLKVVEKADKLMNELLKRGRKGEISYKNSLKEYFKAMNIENVEEMVKKYYEFAKQDFIKAIFLAPYSKENLKKLKEKGVMIIGISDTIHTPKELIEISLKHFGINKYFDELYTSFSLKAEKPEAFKFFELKNTIFLGHDDDEIIGAKKLGLKTIGLNNNHADFIIKNLNELIKIIELNLKNGFPTARF